MTGIATRENPIRRATCNPAGAGFDRIVEIQPDPDSRIGYPSIPTVNKHNSHPKIRGWLFVTKVVETTSGEGFLVNLL